MGHWGGGYMYGPAAQNFFLDFKLCVTRQIRSHRSVGLPLISGPVSMREPGRFEGKAIWPSAARSSVVRAVCSREMSAA